MIKIFIYIKLLIFLIYQDGKVYVNSDNIFDWFKHQSIDEKLAKNLKLNQLIVISYKIDDDKKKQIVGVTVNKIPKIDKDLKHLGESNANSDSDSDKQSMAMLDLTKSKLSFNERKKRTRKITTNSCL